MSTLDILSSTLYKTQSGHWAFDNGLTNIPTIVMFTATEPDYKLLSQLEQVGRCRVAVCYVSSGVLSHPMFDLHMPNPDNVEVRMYLYVNQRPVCAIKPSPTLVKDVNDLIKLMITHVKSS